MSKAEESLVDLYKVFVDEETKFLEMHQGRVKFFLGITSGIVAGTIAGIYKSTLWYQFALMSLGPVLIFFTCSISIEGVFRLYQRFLEAISVRAKLEQQLGLTKTLPLMSEEDYWPGEPIVAPRHFDSRKKYSTSKEWIEAHSNHGYHLWTVRLFRGGQVLALVLLAVIVFLSVHTYKSSHVKQVTSSQEVSNIIG